MLFLYLLAMLTVGGLAIGLLGKFARVGAPAAAVSGSPLRSTVRSSMFSYRDATPEQQDRKAFNANLKASAAEREALRNAIHAAGSSSYKF